MRRRRESTFEPDQSVVDEALAAMDAADLREVVREMLLELDDRAHSRLVTSLIERAARGERRWAPAAPCDHEVAEIVSFAAAAQRVGYADPSDMDERLRSGSNAFLRKDYAAAHRVFDALLRPLARGDIHLGEHEVVDEVLGVDPATCVAQYVASTYMTANAEQRADAVRAAIDEVGGLGLLFEPIREIERVAVDPLPGLDDFLPRWRAVVAKEAAAKPRSTWDGDADRWLREVVLRMDGAAGLAKLARSSRHADDLRAWCNVLVEAGDWKASLAAFEEAAQLVSDGSYVRGELLDGAALAAQELGRKQLSPWFERAWRGEPTMVRLRRWLGFTRSRPVIRKRAAEALAACPKPAHRQRAFLHEVQGDFEPAAKLLAAAPGLGWSNGEHPGHLLFPLFHFLLGGNNAVWTRALPERGDDTDKVGLRTAEHDVPRLATPEGRRHPPAGRHRRQQGGQGPQGPDRGTAQGGREPRRRSHSREAPPPLRPRRVARWRVHWLRPDT
ncbi:MAG: hypothetical protein ACREM1_17945 [Longimicrobiales bacterium]